MDDRQAKALLKSAKERVSADPAASREASNQVVSQSSNAALVFNALLLSALAAQNAKDFAAAEATFRKAAAANPASPMPWNGLVALFEKINNEEELISAIKELLKVLPENSPFDAKKYVSVAVKLLTILDANSDWEDALVVLNKLSSFFLDSSLPTYNESVASEFAAAYDTTQSPQILILNRLIAMQETHDAETFERQVFIQFTHRQVELRRRRLGAADLATTRRIVESEIIASSHLDSYYLQLISLLEQQQQYASNNDDDDAVDNSTLVSSLRGKLLVFLVKKIKHVSALDAKNSCVAHVAELANSIVDSHARYLHSDSSKSLKEDSDAALAIVAAFEFLIQTENVAFDDYNHEILELASKSCPYKAIGLAATGYLKSKSQEFTVDEALDDFNESFELDSQSVFTAHMLAALFHESKDYESCIVFSKKATTLVNQVKADFGIVLDRVTISIESTLAQSYCKIGPKFHQDAVTLYTSILQREPTNVSALHGLATAYSIVRKYSEALEYLDKVLYMDDSNDGVVGDIGWIKYRQFSEETGEEVLLQESLDLLSRALELNDCAVHNYRIGKVLWAFGGESRNRAYTHFLKAVKQDSSTPGAFTAIGLFCLLVDQNRVRAKKCFQKALEADAKDEEAVLELIKLLLEEGEVDFARTALLEFASLSARSAVVWRYLGFISLKNNEFQESINYFQSSLRLDTKSVASWEGLGEAYGEEGKYMAALKAFTRAFELDPTSLFSVYQSAQIKFKLGLYTDAITDFKTVKQHVDDTSSETHTGFLIPCLKSMADCYLSAARESFSLGAYGVCFDHLNAALEACLRVIESSTQFQCIFKILGDVCMSFYIYKSAHVVGLVDLQVLGKGFVLLGGTEGDFGHGEIVAEDGKRYAGALQLAVNAYKIAIHICTHGANAEFAVLSSAYLHDLAMAYHYLHELYLENGIEEEMCLKMCLASMWKALHSDPQNENLWNSLGVFALRVNSKIAQHSLIKAAELNEKTVEPWTNLGYFYYFNGDMDLAKQSFNRAQLLDPENCLSWYGQALINSQTAKTNNTAAESLDLFDHANDLAQGQNLEVGFSYALSEYQRYISGLEQDASVLAAPVFSMIKFCEVCVNDVAGFTLLGLLREKQGGFEEAVKAFGKALEICRALPAGMKAGESLSECLVNYARALCSAGLYSDAVQVYDEFFQNTDGDVLARVGFGLALFFEVRLEESLASFQEALNMLARMEFPNVLLQNKVGVLLSQVLYALGSEVHLALAKDQLMECIHRGTGFPQALISLLALGIVTQNDALAQGAAADLIKEKPESLVGLESDRNSVLSRYFLLQGGSKLSRGFLAKNIHQAPWKAGRWLLLSDNISRYAPEIQDSLVTVAKSAVVLQHSHTRSAPISARERAAIQQSLGHALLTRKRPMNSRDGINSYSSRSCFHSAIHSNPSNARMWLSLGIDLRTQSASDDLLDPEKTDIISKATEVICQTSVSLASATTLDVSWANIILADSNVVRGLAFMALGHEDVAVQVLQGALEMTEQARSDGECVDRRVMAMGYAVGARALYAMGDQGTAFGAYRNAIMCVPELVAVWEELAEAYTNANRFQQAIIALVQALSIAQTNASKCAILTRLAKVHLMTENGPDSTEALNQLKELDRATEFGLIQCVSMIKFGNAGALNKTKKVVAAALETESDCAWALWMSEQFNLR
ncbi:UNVERIFIED_CONTAM: Tetratricopeptide repeat protein 37 [Siphonaria sp. JEL0065]|nr:Tetratricopeptide repeat protein 37 [Siphonaria sp. JEL0065]